MNKLIIPLLLAFASSATFASDDASMSGKWQVHSSIAGNDSDLTCTFSDKDNDLSGTCTSADKVDLKITGKIDGKKVSWSYKSEYNGTPLTVQYEGTVDSSNKIKGTVTVPEFSVDGDFTATHST